MIIVETVKRPPEPYRPLRPLRRTFHQEGPLWWPDYETPFGHVLVHWLTADLWRSDAIEYDPITGLWRTRFGVYAWAISVSFYLYSPLPADWLRAAGVDGVRRGHFGVLVSS